MSWLRALPLAETPVTIGREEARRAAERELADPEYQRQTDGLLQRALRWLLEKLQDLLSGLGGADLPDGLRWLPLTTLLVVLVGIAVLLFWLRRRLGPVRGTRLRRELLADSDRTAAEHRAAAARYEAAGQWAEAVREHLRAVARGLEERALLAERPGRTADEMAAEAGRLLPDLASELATAALVFDDVWYGGRTATAEMAAAVRQVEGRVRTARPLVETA